MTTLIRQNNIRLIQCQFADCIEELYKALAYGRTDVNCLKMDARLVSAYLKRVYCYKNFDSQVFYAYQIGLTKTSSNSVTIDINIDDQLFQYIGTDTANTILQFFKDLINDNTQTTEDYTAEMSDGILYIYSYSSTADFDDATTISITGDSNASGSTLSLENNTDTILNLWNDLTEGEICSIINDSYKTLEKCQ